MTNEQRQESDLACIQSLLFKTMKKSGLTRKQIAKKTKMSTQDIRNLLKGDDLTIKQISSIIFACGYDWDLLVLAKDEQ